MPPTSKGDEGIRRPAGGAARLALFAGATGLFAAAVHLRTLWGGLLEFDDQFFILTDRAIRGLGLDNLKIILSKPYFANYHPLTRLSFAIDHAAFGHEPFGYHLTNVLLYGIGCSVVFLVFEKLFKNRYAAFLAALLFAAHTTHVEVVAWISARKDVLLLLFGSLALYLHLERRARPGPSAALYLWLVLCCALAGLSKSLAVILPLLFLSVDLIRFRVKNLKGYLYLLPILGIMIFVGWMNIHAQGEAGAIKSEPIPLLGAGKVFLDYGWKTVLPVNLSARYVLDPKDIQGVSAWAGLLVFTALPGLAVLLLFMKRRLFPLAYCWYLLPLLPVSNIVFPLSTPMADRYLLWPSMAWCLLLGGMLASLEGARARAACTAALLLLLAAYTALTAARCEAWLDDRSLWEDALEQNPDNHMALASMGRIAIDEGRKAEARDYLARALEAARGIDASLYLDQGRLLLDEGRKEEALAYFRKAYAGEGDKGWFAGRAAHSVGLALSELGRGEEALAWYEKAIAHAARTQESTVNILLSMAKVYYDGERFDRAEALYGRACREAPRDPRPRFYIGLARMKQGRHTEAAADFHASLGLGELPPGVRFDYGDVHLMLGKAYQEHLGRGDLALHHYSEVLRLDPEHPQRAALREMIRLLER